MKYLRKLPILVALCLLLTALPVARAVAAETGSMWLRHMPAEDGVEVALIADTAIASGVITITYDPELLTFQSLAVEEDYVLAHAVNAKEAGTIRISWIGTDKEADAHVLMRLQFAGDALAVATLSGSVQNEAGDDVAITALDFGPLNAAISKANGLKAEDYTADSFAGLKTALDAALAQEAVETVTQAQLDGAAQALSKAMENLAAFVPTPPPTDPTEPTTPPTEPTEPTEPAPTDPKPTQKPADQPTQAGSQPATTQPVVSEPQPKGNEKLLIVGAALALCAAAAVAAVLILKKRGKK